MVSASVLVASPDGRMRYMEAISLRGVTKKFKSKGREELLAILDVDLEIKQGEFFVFVGPSGSGKSTLLRIMSGLEKDYEGVVRLGPGLASNDISFVFQHFALLPWLTVGENTELGLRARHTGEQERNKIIEKELDRFGLLKFKDAYPRELSGGMRQRVGLARAMSTSPKIIFMDEPFSELDSFTAEELRKELLAVWQEKKTTIVMVTHVIEEALELSDRVAVLTPRPGKIEKIVEVKLARPRDKRSPDFYALEDQLYEIIKP